MSQHAEHTEVSDKLKRLPRDTITLWDRLEKSTAHPLHRKRASELFLEVLTLQNGGTEIDWPSIYCAITTLTRLDKECLQARLAVGCSKSPSPFCNYCMADRMLLNYGRHASFHFMNQHKDIHLFDAA